MLKIPLDLPLSRKTSNPLITISLPDGCSFPKGAFPQRKPPAPLRGYVRRIPGGRNGNDLKDLGDKVVELFAGLRRHQRTFGAALPAVFDAACPHLTPRRLFVRAAPRTVSFAEFAAVSAKKPAGRDFGIHN